MNQRSGFTFQEPDRKITPSEHEFQVVGRTKNIDRSIEFAYPRVNTLIMLLFCGYVVAWYLQIGYRIPALGAIRFEFIYAAMVSLLAMAFVNKKNLYVDLYAYSVLYYAALVIQIPFSYDINTSWSIFIDRVVKFSFMALFIAIFVRSPRHLKYFLAAFMLACMKMGQEGLWGKITGMMVWENQGVMRLNGCTPLYAHPNSYSGMALGTLPFVYHFMSLSSWPIKALLLTQVVFACNIILYTASRTGYVAFLFLVLYVIYHAQIKRRAVVYSIVLCLATVPLIPQQYIQRFHSIITQKEKEGASAKTRKQIIVDAVSIFKEHPLGVGIAAFPAVRQQTFGRSQDTHNLYLEVATNLGIQGFAVFFLLIYKILKTLILTSRDLSCQIETLEENLARAAHGRDRVYAINGHLSDLKVMKATCDSVYLYVLIRLVLGLFGMDLYEIYWWFALGLTVSLVNMNKVASIRTERLSQFPSSPILPKRLRSANLEG